MSDRRHGHELAHLVLASKQNVGAEMRAAAEAVLRATPSPAAPAVSDDYTLHDAIRASAGLRPAPIGGSPGPEGGGVSTLRADGVAPQPASAETRYRVFGRDVYEVQTPGGRLPAPGDRFVAKCVDPGDAVLIVTALNGASNAEARSWEACAVELETLGGKWNAAAATATGTPDCPEGDAYADAANRVRRHAALGAAPGVPALVATAEVRCFDHNEPMIQYATDPPNVLRCPSGDCDNGVQLTVAAPIRATPPPAPNARLVEAALDVLTAQEAHNGNVKKWKRGERVVWASLDDLRAALADEGG